MKICGTEVPSPLEQACERALGLCPEQACERVLSCLYKPTPLTRTPLVVYATRGEIWLFEIGCGLAKKIAALAMTRLILVGVKCFAVDWKHLINYRESNLD